MDLNSIEFFRVGSRRMEWLGARQRVLAENIANADTPGYKAKDVQSFDEYLEGARSTSLAVTNDRHIGHGQAGGIQVEKVKTTWGESLDGNNVVLEEQTMLSSEVSSQYNMATSLYKKGYGLLKAAVSN